MIETLLQSTGIWVTISFVLFVLLAYKKGKQSVVSSLDAKIEKIKTDLETAEGLRIEAQELLAQYQRQQREADKEAKSLIKDAEKQANLIKKTAEADFKDVQKNRETWLKQRVKRMEEDAIAEIQAQVADLSAKATEEILVSEIDQKTHDQMVDLTIKNLSKSVH